ncbi:hypothetical protein Tco_0813647 [Tanacetum coccineum]
MIGERFKPRPGVLFVEGMQPTGFGREFGVDPQAAIDREMQHMGEQIFGAGLELIVGFDLRAFEGLNCELGKGEERITWNPWIKHHPPRHILQVCYWPILHYKGNQRQSWDPGITAQDFKGTPRGQALKGLYLQGNDMKTNYREILSALAPLHHGKDAIERDEEYRDGWAMTLWMIPAMDDDFLLSCEDVATMIIQNCLHTGNVVLCHW